MEIEISSPGIFGRLTIQKFYKKNSDNYWYNREWYAICSCSCGSTMTTKLYNLTSGRSRSCGCLNGKVRRRKDSNYAMKYSENQRSIYFIWAGMKSRCNNVNNEYYHRYGGRGISVCDRWNDFKNFLEDMGPKPGKGYSLDRIDNDGDYCKENCRWTDYTTQANNTSRTRKLEYRGQSLSVSELARMTGIKYSKLLRRINNGMPVSEAVIDNDLRSQEAGQ